MAATVGCVSNLDDLEDIVETNPQLKTADFSGQEENKETNYCVGKPLKYTVPFDPDRPKPITTLENSIPGTQTIYVKTWGCSHNMSDSEYMAGLLSEYGYQIITEEKKADLADLWLLNSCTVKGPSQDHFLTMTRRAKLKKKFIVVAGCVPQGDKKIEELMGISVVGVQQIDRVVEVVEETLKGHTVQLYSLKRRIDETKSHTDGGGKRKRKDGGARLNLPKIRKNPLIEIIPINTGCLNQCTYCKTKHARGDLGSYPVSEILERIEYVINEGIVREIWLTSEDTGAYGLDINTNIGILLESICNLLDSKKHCTNSNSKLKLMIRIGMTNPPYIGDHLGIISKCLNHPNIFSFLHLPVQAGSDHVLDDMRRKYHRKDFENVCNYLLNNVPRVHIATDIICGFPSETEEDFDETMDLLNKYKFTTLNISQFYPRPGTVAAKMKKLNTKIVKSRSRRMTKLFKSYIPFKERIGECHRILITSMARDGYHYCGHNKCYDHFIVAPLSLDDGHDNNNDNDLDLMGEICDVEIIEVGKYHLKGKIILETLDDIVKNNLLPNNGLSKQENEKYLKGILSVRELNDKQRQLIEESMMSNDSNDSNDNDGNNGNNNINGKENHLTLFAKFRTYFVFAIVVVLLASVIIPKMI